MEITFAERKITDVFEVRDVKRSILPPRQNFSLDVPSKHGQYYLGYKYSPRYINVEIIMLSDNILANMRSLAWLLDVEEPAKLEFSDEPDKYYLAVLDSSTDLDQIFNVGTGVLSFVCFSPYAYSKLEKTYSADETGKLTLINGGTAKVAPKFEIDFTSECGFLSIVSPRGIIQIGQTHEIDVIPAPDSERLVNDNMSSNATVILNTNGRVRTPNATIQGTIWNNNSNIRPDSYGTPTAGWHGMTIRKELDTTADYWETSMTFKFQSDEYFGKTPMEKQIGKLEFNVMSDTNEFIAGFTMSDNLMDYGFNVPQFYVGDTLVYEEKPNIPAPTGNLSGKTIGRWNNFIGKIIIRKEKDKFYFELQKIEAIDPLGDEMIDPTYVSEIASKTWIDTQGTFNGVKAKALNIWFGKYSTFNPIALNYVEHITFRKDYVDQYINVPNVFGAGDKVIVDCNRSEVYLNQTLWMDKVDVGSQFFEVVEGETEIFIIDSSVLTRPVVTAKIIEKYL